MKYRCCDPETIAEITTYKEADPDTFGYMQLETEAEDLEQAKKVICYTCGCHNFDDAFVCDGPDCLDEIQRLQEIEDRAGQGQKKLFDMGAA